MIKFLLLSISLNFVFLTYSQSPWENGTLKVLENDRYLKHLNGKLFFWQGDIAWLLLQRLNRDEMKSYFQNRKAKGFNVVQCVFLQFYTDKNAYGDSAYMDRELTTPSTRPGNNPNDPAQYDFWDHAEYAVDMAAQNGIYLAIAPTWGQLVKRDSNYTREKAQRFASALANRFKNKQNIIWINARPYFERVNHQSTVVDNGERYDRVIVSKGNAYLMAYTNNGRDFTLQLGAISGTTVNAWWYKPRTGKASLTGKYNNGGKVVFSPPGEKADGNDWVLVLDDASKKFKTPGVIK